MAPVRYVQVIEGRYEVRSLSRFYNKQFSALCQSR